MQRYRCCGDTRALWTLRTPTQSNPTVLTRGGRLGRLDRCWLRERMSSFGPVSAGRSPVFVRPTTGAVSRRFCGLCYCCLSSACVLVPELRVVVLCIRLPRGGRLRVCCCGQMALAAFPRCAGMFTLPVQSRQPRSRCWSRMLPTLKSLGPFKLP